MALGVRLIGSGRTAATIGHGAGWVTFLHATRFVAGMGIGGEYAAIDFAIARAFGALGPNTYGSVVNSHRVPSWRTSWARES